MSNFNLVTDARLAQGVYSSNNSASTDAIDGWRPIYVDPQDLKLSETFGAQLYKNDAGQYKVVFRGTEGNLADWAQNFKYGTFQWSDEFKDTVAFMAKAVVQVADKEFGGDVKRAAQLFTTTGHSQGGFEAELAALMFGVKGTSLDGMGATGVVEQFRAKLNKVMQDNGAGDLVRTDAELTLKTEDFLTRIYTVVGRLGVHTGETDGAWTWSATKLVAVFNPALAGAAVVGGLRAHMIADIVANEELRERSPLWRAIGDAGDILNPDNSNQLAQSVASQWASVQVADASNTLPALPDSSHVQSQLQAFLQDHAGQNYDQQTLGKNILVRTEGGDTFMIYADGTTKVVAKVGDTTTVREYAKDGSLQAARQERPDGLGNTIVNEQGVGFEGSMTVSGTGQVISAKSSTYQGSELKTTTEVSSQTINGQSVQVTETINHLAKGSEVASSKELVTEGGAKIVNSTTADGHIQEDTYATVDGKQQLQSSKVISYSQAERDTATLDVSLAGLELMQALRAGNKVQAAASLIRLANSAEIASNQMPTLGAIGTGFSGAVSIVSALDSWGDASDGERIALTARAVLG
uniref:Mbeg1-like protein n=1 Tax=Limnohabitans sp. TaxID=1907725 RepID=UPI0035B444B8